MDRCHRCRSPFLCRCRFVVLVGVIEGLDDLAVPVRGITTVGVLGGLVLFFDETQVFQRLLDC